MFDHKNLALGGFYPGLVTTLSVANLGTFDVEVIITPVVSGGGGGYVPVVRGQKPDRYRVTVRVIHGQRRYEESIIVDDFQARITAKMNGITEFVTDEVMISINGVQVNKSNPIFTITK